MKKIKKTYASSGYDFGEEVPTCSYCNSTAKDTDIWETHICSDFICGEIDCWHEYMMSQVIHNQIECTETEIEVCDGCHESKDTSYDGMCFLCWEDTNEHLEEDM